MVHQYCVAWLHFIHNTYSQVQIGVRGIGLYCCSGRLCLHDHANNTTNHNATLARVHPIYIPVFVATTMLYRYEAFDILLFHT